MTRVLVTFAAVVLTISMTAIGHGSDIEEIAKLFRQAGEQHNADAQFTLGRFYAEGAGAMRQSDRQAAFWFKRAAQQGHAEAQLMIANLYMTGRGVSSDNMAAYKWASLAAVSTRAVETREKALSLLKTIGERLTDKEIREVQERLSMWHPEPEVRPEKDKLRNQKNQETGSLADDRTPSTLHHSPSRQIAQPDDVPDSRTRVSKRGRPRSPGLLARRAPVSGRVYRRWLRR